MKQWIVVAAGLVLAAPGAMAQAQVTHVVPVISPEKALIVHRLPAPDVVNTGRIDKQALIASVPYAYNKPLTLATDYKPVVTGKLIAKGTRGFDAGYFTTNFSADPVHVICLFGNPAAFSGPDTPATAPTCFIPEYTTLFGKLQAGELQTQGNIPTSFSGNPLPLKPPPITEDDTPIDHDFHIDISYKRWFKNVQGDLGIVVYFKSEGRIMDELYLAVDADNTLRLDLGDGILKLRIDPSDKDHVYADFDKAPAQ